MAMYTYELGKRYGFTNDIGTNAISLTCVLHYPHNYY